MIIVQVLFIDSIYFAKFLKHKNLLLDQHGSVCKVKGYSDYNHLISINDVFSTHPLGEPNDRTGRVKTPLKIYAGRPWDMPNTKVDLDEALMHRVKDLASSGQKINVMWSGGIDSTTVVNAMIKNLEHKDQLRVIYSPFSQYEHPEYLKFLDRSGIETIDMSGTVYLDTRFDGIFITGDTGDEAYGSLDETFLEKHGIGVLYQDWKTFFWCQTKNTNLMDFCEKYFNDAVIEIKSVLEARWWFYINSKQRCVLNRKLCFWLDYPNFHRDLVRGFFDCPWFERYISHNLHNVIQPQGYHTWKQDLKNYCFDIDGFKNYRDTKIKVNSNQLNTYARKKRAMKDLFSFFVLEDGTSIRTDTMPFFSASDLEEKYGDYLDEFWNTPDTI